MKLHCLQHVAFEGLACLRDWAEKRGFDVSVTRLYAGETLPDPGDADLLAVMGGPMNIYEEDLHPWLRAEKRFIAEAIAARRRVLGICLGAQLIADVLGGKVRRNPVKEIGWFPVRKTAAARPLALLQDWPAGCMAYHWHGDTFSIPPGAVHLASSDACENQAFLHGDNALGLQFHLEMTPESARAIIENCRGELVAGDTIQTPAQMLSDSARFAEANARIGATLDRWIGTVR